MADLVILNAKYTSAEHVNAIMAKANHMLALLMRSMHVSSVEQHRGAESESESPEVVATSQESESIKLPRLRLRDF